MMPLGKDGADLVAHFEERDVRSYTLYHSTPIYDSAPSPFTAGTRLTRNGHDALWDRVRRGIVVGHDLQVAGVEREVFHLNTDLAR
jgi:hypothetical protein